MTSQVLERGDVYFLYQPARGEERVSGLTDVYHFFVVLKPSGKDVFRRLVVGQKKLPASGEEEERYWGFVDDVSRDDALLRAALSREGDARASAPGGQAPRLAGEGVYAIVAHEDHTDLAYRLELPERPGEAQEALRIRDKGSFLLSIKNPEAGSPPGAGLDTDEKVAFPSELQRKFGDHRWIGADPPAFLDHAHAEFLLVATDEAAQGDVGAGLESHAREREASSVLDELRARRDDPRLAPLFDGTWR